MPQSNVNVEDFFYPGDSRLFVEVGPTRPGGTYDYVGTGGTMDTDIKLGATTPTRIQSRRQRRKWDTVGTKQAPPDLATTGIHMLMPRKVASFLEKQLKTGCVVNLQLVVGTCNSPDEFSTGWESKILYEAAHLDDLKVPGMPSVDGSNLDEIYHDGSMTFEYYDRIFSMLFGEKAGPELVAEAIDGVYAGAPSCGDCGPYSEGNDHLYLLQKANAGSPGLSGQLVYTNDGSNFDVVDIPGLGGTSPNAIEAIGDFLVVVSEADRTIQYCRRVATILASDWQQVSSGFVAAHGPRAIYAKNPGEVYFAGAGGYIYKSNNYQQSVTPIESGSLSSSNYNKIDGDGGSVVVAVGDSNLVIVTTNNGQTFSSVTGPQVGADLQALQVLDANNWIVGGDGGAFYYTNDGGLNWTAIPFSLSGSGAIITDIAFSPQTFVNGFMTVEVGGRGYVYRTTDGGTHWFNDEPSVRGLASNARLNFVAPSSNNINVAAVGGLAVGGSDGFAAVGA